MLGILLRFNIDNNMLEYRCQYLLKTSFFRNVPSIPLWCAVQFFLLHIPAQCPKYPFENNI